MRIYLCDHTHTSRSNSKWHSVLKRVFGNQFEHGQTEKWSEPERIHPAYSDSNAILFCHSDGGEPRWRKRANLAACHVITVRGAGGQSRVSNKKGNFHACYWSPDDFIKASQRADLRMWIEQVKSGVLANIQWDLLQPNSPNHVPRRIAIPLLDLKRELGPILVMGAGSYADSLAKKLEASWVDFQGISIHAVDNRPAPQDPDYGAAVIVLKRSDSAARAALHHRLLWQVKGMNQVRIAILTACVFQTERVVRQDVFGNDGGNETFGKWADRYLVMTREDDLTELIRGLSRLNPMWASVWRRHDSAMTTIRRIHRWLTTAIEIGSLDGRIDILRDMRRIAWDCFCIGHPEANRLRRWYERDENCHAWIEEGIALLNPIMLKLGMPP